MIWNDYEFNFPLRYLSANLLDIECKLIAVCMAVEYLPGRQTEALANLLGWSQSTFAKWAQLADSVGLIRVKMHEERGSYLWKTYHMPQEKTP